MGYVSDVKKKEILLVNPTDILIETSLSTCNNIIVCNYCFDFSLFNINFGDSNNH